MRHAINGINRQTESVCLVPDRQLKRRVNVALLPVPPNVEILAARAFVCQTMDHPGVAVEVEHNGFVIREEGYPFPIRQTMRVFARMNELEEVDAVDKADA